MNAERWGWMLLAGGTVAAAVTGASAADLLRRYRIKRLSGVAEMAGTPVVLDPSAPDCGVVPGVPEVFGDTFDPGAWDQIDLAGNGRLVVYASNATAGSPGSRAIVVHSEGTDPVFVTEAAGDDDQPSVQFDRFGFRLAFRGSTSVAGESGSDVYLYTNTRGAGDDAGAETVNLTQLDLDGGERAFDPVVAARVISRSVGSGIEVRERDARVAFISNGDLDKGKRPVSSEEPGRNPTGALQLFQWHERSRKFRQLTDNTDLFAAMNRPTMSGNGRFIVFESTANLDPDGANPRDPAEVGNPGGVRQLFLWRKTRKGSLVRQITWSDADCFAPRMTHNGKHVFFCSQGDLLPGGNPEGNYEIFRWTRGRKASRRLAQLTQTTEGDSVFPRPMRNPRRFVFTSTSMPPVGGIRFGGGPRQCSPAALMWVRGRVKRIYGVLDAENLELIAAGSDPVLVGPPAAVYPNKIQFATNDPILDPPDATGAASLLRFHMARATKFPRR